MARDIKPAKWLCPLRDSAVAKIELDEAVLAAVETGDFSEFVSLAVGRISSRFGLDCSAVCPRAELLFQPDVTAYVAASVEAAALPAAAAPRCGTGHSTCTHAHLGIGPQCEPGTCRVNEADAGEGVTHG